jgi:hypothetical protein
MTKSARFLGPITESFSVRFFVFFSRVIIQNISMEKLVIPSNVDPPFDLIQSALKSVLKTSKALASAHNKGHIVRNPNCGESVAEITKRKKKKVSTFLPQMGMSPCHRPSLPQLMVGFLTGR